MLSERPLRIALVAGEASGDLLGAGLVRELKARFPNAEFAGIGGDAMRSAGCQTWHDASELAVMGLTEVLRHRACSSCVRRSASVRLTGSRTCSSASTPRLQPGYRALAEAAWRERALRQSLGLGLARAPRRSAAAPTWCCACSRWTTDLCQARHRRAPPDGR